METFFTNHEMLCPCCSQSTMDGVFMEMLNKARGIAGIPFRISSGFRCYEHNKEIGSTSTNHVNGKAADISCMFGEARLKIIKGLLDAGFKRLGIGKRFIHCDTNGVVNSIWLY